MDKRDERILTALVDNERMKFQQIVDLFVRTGEHNRGMVHTRLKGLVKEQLIEDENKEMWSIGQSRWFSITAEGEKRILNESVAAVAESLKKVRDLTAHIAQQNPERLDGLRRHLWKAKEGEEDLEKLKQGALPLEEYVRRFEERTKENPIRESFKALYEILLKVNCPAETPEEEFAVAILEKGSICLLSMDRLRKLGFIPREPEKAHKLTNHLETSR